MKEKKKIRRKRRNTAGPRQRPETERYQMRRKREDHGMRGNYWTGGHPRRTPALCNRAPYVIQSRSADPPFRNLSAGIDAIARHIARSNDTTRRSRSSRRSSARSRVPHSSRDVYALASKIRFRTLKEQAHPAPLFSSSLLPFDLLQDVKSARYRSARGLSS